MPVSFNELFDNLDSNLVVIELLSDLRIRYPGTNTKIQLYSKLELLVTQNVTLKAKFEISILVYL